MKQKDFAEVSWAVEDVLHSAEELDIPISRKKAGELLRSVENRIEDAMVSAGWEVVEGALRQMKSIDQEMILLRKIGLIGGSRSCKIPKVLCILTSKWYITV